jgi:iron complex transport system ATP-binding protein
MTALRGIQLQTGYDGPPIISGLDVSIPKGRITSIIGPNGCGKSTLLKALARLLPLQAGEVLMNGRSLAKLSSRQIAHEMAILPQSPLAPPNLTVKELVAYGRYPHQRGFGQLKKKDREKIGWALESTNLTDLAERRVDALSGGQRQRVWIAMALAQDTEMILLDEPTTYLDLVHQLEVLQLLQRLNVESARTIALVIHEINMAARFSDHIIAMKEGKIIAEGPPVQVITEDVLRRVFNIDAVITQEPHNGSPVCLTYDIAERCESVP